MLCVCFFNKQSRDYGSLTIIRGMDSFLFKAKTIFAVQL